MFSKNGTIGKSRMYIDTVIKTSVHNNRGVVFAKLEKSFIDSSDFKKSIPSKYLESDSTSYFILANFTKIPIKISRINNHLETEEISQFEKNFYKPINLFIHSFCVQGTIEGLSLNPSEILIIRDDNRILLSPESYESKTYLRLKTSTGIIVTGRYTKKILKTDFFIPTEMEKDFDLIKRQVAFQD